MGAPSLTSAALFLLGWSCGWLLLWRPRPLPARPRRPAGPEGPAPRPPLAVVIPARDEEASLPLLLATVVPQLRPGDRCLVVDDDSTDRTAAVAAGAGAEVVAAPPRPDGWTGKAWACATGAARAAPNPSGSGDDVLVFLDADVRLEHSDVLDRLAAEVSTLPDGLVSIQPWHRTDRPVEQLSLFFNVTALMGSIAFTVLGTRVRPTLAFGPVLSCRRAAYEASGGHAHPSVRGAMAEDIALARRFPSVALFTGRPAVSFRMYPDGLRALIQGWTKNIASGAASVRWWFLIPIVGWLWSLNGGWITSVWFYAASAVQVLVLGRRAGRFGPLSALAYPLLVLFFLVMFLRSVALTLLRRPMPWKGRRVAPRPPH
jgi:4,4'-diaponeurosporenoate glycosyltransferase